VKPDIVTRKDGRSICGGPLDQALLLAESALHADTLMGKVLIKGSELTGTMTGIAANASINGAAGAVKMVATAGRSAAK